jgi:hypothetical protein
LGNVSININEALFNVFNTKESCMKMHVVWICFVYIFNSAISADLEVNGSFNRQKYVDEVKKTHTAIRQRRTLGFGLPADMRLNVTRVQARMDNGYIITPQLLIRLTPEMYKRAVAHNRKLKNQKWENEYQKK